MSKPATTACLRTISTPFKSVVSRIIFFPLTQYFVVSQMSCRWNNSWLFRAINFLLLRTGRHNTGAETRTQPRYLIARTTSSIAEFHNYTGVAVDILAANDFMTEKTYKLNIAIFIYKHCLFNTNSWLKPNLWVFFVIQIKFCLQELY